MWFAVLPINDIGFLIGILWVVPSSPPESPPESPGDRLVLVEEEVLVGVVDDLQILDDHRQQVGILLLGVLDLVLLLSLLELEAGVEAWEGALSRAFSFAPIPR